MSLVLVAISVLKELQEVHLQLPIVKGVRMTPAPESAFIDDDVFYLFLQKQKIGAELHIYLEEGTSGLTAAQDKLQHQVKAAMMEPLEWMQGIQSDLTVCGGAPASGGPMLGMLVETLVERVFLVSGVVKTVFCCFKKK